MNTKRRIIIDTNVFIASLKSNRGASYKLLYDVSENAYDMCISPALIFEYESVAKRGNVNISFNEIDDILDMICLRAKKYEMHFLWRPFLKDPKDDFLLELAIESLSKYIITYNIRDFAGVSQFGIKVINPKEFLHILGAI